MPIFFAEATNLSITFWTFDLRFIFFFDFYFSKAFCINAINCIFIFFFFLILFKSQIFWANELPPLSDKGKSGS